MIYSLRGSLIHASPGTAVVECAGVGYKCMVSMNTLSQLPPRGEEVFLLTYMSVREDVVDLFGFSQESELQCFRMLTSVNGVGPKLALVLLSDFTPDTLTFAIASGDAKKLTGSSGVGPKLASRIVLELKDKLGGFSVADSATLNTAFKTKNNSAFNEAIQALASLGYSPSDAAMALSDSDDAQSVEQLIKAGLKRLARS